MNWCCEKEIKPLYDNIKYKKYFKPIKKFSKVEISLYNEILDYKHVLEIGVLSIGGLVPTY
jgi:hypothetical protein